MRQFLKVLRRKLFLIMLSAFGVALFFLLSAWIIRRPLDVRITLRSSVNTILQLFYDQGRGFNYRDSVTMLVNESPDFTTIDLRLPPVRIQHLVLAPLSTPGSVQIQTIQLVNGRQESLQKMKLSAPLSVTAQTVSDVDNLLIEIPFLYPLKRLNNGFMVTVQTLLVGIGSCMIGILLVAIYSVLSCHNRFLTIAIVVLGLGLRFVVGLRGHNFDFESWKLVASILAQGGNVYTETTRYNYGPIWGYMLWIARQIAALTPLSDEMIFRYVIIGLLSAVDLGIWRFLSHRYGRLVAALFFLNPISVIITGYHNQFENLAVLLGMYALELLGDDHDRKLQQRHVLGFIVLGLSLMTKHVLFFFPMWLLVKQKGWLRKILSIGIPYGIFGLGFLPYWNARQAIWQNVFLYVSSRNEPFFRWFVPEVVKLVVTNRMFWFALLLIGAVIVRNVNNADSLLLYTTLLVIGSPADC